MRKIEITDKYLDNFVEQPTESLVKDVVSKELCNQLDQYCKPKYVLADQLYKPEFLFAKLKQMGIDVKGNEEGFNVYFGGVRVVFTAHFCQVEGLSDHYYPRFKLDKFAVDGLAEFVRQFPSVIDIVKVDLEVALARCAELALNRKRKEKEQKISMSTSQILLEDFFKKKGYKCAIKAEGGVLWVSVNLSAKRKLEFKESATKLAGNYADILNYLARFLDTLKESPLTLKIK